MIRYYFIPSKHLLVLKMSSRHVLKTYSTRLQRNNFTYSKMSWKHLVRRLQDVLEDKKFSCWRRLQDVLKTCLEDVLKTCLEDLLKTCLEDFLKTLWRQTKYLLEISVSNNSKYVSTKSIFHKSLFDIFKANSKCIN